MLIEQTLVPSPPLEEFVSRYIVRQDRLGAHELVRRITASPTVVLVLSLSSSVEVFEYDTKRTRIMPAAFVVGPLTGRRADVVTRGRSGSIAVRFQPAGFSRLFHVSVEPLADKAVDACQVLGPA